MVKGGMLNDCKRLVFFNEPEQQAVVRSSNELNKNCSEMIWMSEEGVYLCTRF